MTLKGSFGDGMSAVLLGQSYSLAGAFSKVVKFRAFSFAAAQRSDVEHIRTIQRESALDTFVVDDSANCEHLVYSPAFAGNNSAGEDLDTLLAALDDSAMDIDRITYFEMRDIIF